VLIDQLVEDARSLSSSSDDAGSVKECEVLRCVLLNRANCSGKLLNRRWPVPKASEQLYPYRLSSHTDPLGDQFD